MKFAKTVVLVVVVLLTLLVGYDYGYASKDKTTTAQATWSTASHGATAKPMTKTSDEVRAETYVGGSSIRAALYVVLFFAILATLATLGLIRFCKMLAANHRSFKSAMAQRVGPAFGPIDPTSGDTLVPVWVNER
jgi:hypothetical protein